MKAAKNIKMKHDKLMIVVSDEHERRAKMETLLAQ